MSLIDLHFVLYLFSDGDSLTVMSDSVNTSSKTKLCPLCKATGKTNKLRLYQINLTEAVLLCTGEKVSTCYNSNVRKRPPHHRGSVNVNPKLSHV